MIEYKIEKLIFLYLNIFNAFSLCSLIITNYLQNIRTAVDFNQGTDGQKFLEEIINGGKISSEPRMLIFTAPYKLCEGGCSGKGSGNIDMRFPMYVGKKGIETYRNMYVKDIKELHQDNENAPFRKSTTRIPFTNCRTQTLTLPTTIRQLQIQILSSTTPPTTMTRCPIIPGMCAINKRNKKKNRSIITVLVFLTLSLVCRQTTRAWYDSASDHLQKMGFPFRRKYIDTTIPPTYECQCPPSKECIVDFKLNQDMFEFLNLRGVLKNKDLEKANEYVTALMEEEARGDLDDSQKATVLRSRRQAKEECCCPPRSFMIPTFITDKKFETIAKKLSLQETNI